MEPLVIGVVVVAAAVIGWMVLQQQRSQSPRSRYAGESDRTVSELSGPIGEAELVRRDVGAGELKILPLSDTEQVRYLAEWRHVQEQFVDDPESAVIDGRDLVEEVLRGRGYPIAADFDRRVAEISVDHPQVVQNYRLAREILARHRRGSSSTEELHQAMLLYRELFNDLLDDPEDPVVSTERVVTRPVERDVAIEKRVGSHQRYIHDREVRP
jgi:hypothetical protein